MNHTRTHKTVRSLLVWLLLLTMVFGLLPMAAFADEAVVEPVVSEEPVQEPEPSSESTEAPSEPTQEPTQEPEPEQPGNADVTIEGDEEQPEDEMLAAVPELVFMTKNSYSYVELTNTNTAGLPRGSNYRAVMLDCGRKYFTVEQIKTLIDMMAEYKYNQLQLSFGNGGCRLLLDDMDLTYVDSNLTSDIVKSGIRDGNKAFNGDGSYLTQTEMTDIIGYARGKEIDIVPMLNMPGHAMAIDYAFTGETDDSLATGDNNVREYAFALLKKYVDYFKSEGCQYFHFGSDESSEKDENGKMTTFLASCANIVANAGMRPRAFNDETNLGKEAIPSFVQITYWLKYGENNSEKASTLSNDGYQLINTHGDWYYVVSSGAPEKNKSVQYSEGVRIELPMLKKGDPNKNTWPSSKNIFYDNISGQGSEVAANLGTMFCIWCDNSTADGDHIISDNEQYGALYQLQELAKLYWGNEISTGGGEPGGGETGDNVINLVVGQTSSKIATTADVGTQTTNDAYIATASVTKGTATEKTLKEIKTESELSADKQYLIVNIRQNKMLTATTSTWKGNNCLALNGEPTVDSTNLWKITTSGSYYTIQYVNGSKYLNIGNNTASVGNSANLTLSYNTNTTKNAQPGWNISYEQKVTNWYGGTTTYQYYLNNLGDTFNAGGWNDNSAANDPGSKWRIYEIAETTAASSNVLTITGTGEGETTASIGGVEYTIRVTAPETSETKTLNFGESFTLPEGAEASVVSGGDLVTIADGKVTAGAVAGSAVVTAVTKNDGGKVTARYTYNITIREVDLSGVAPLPVELWITNDWIGETSSPSSLQTHDVAAGDVYGEDGRNLGDLVVSPAYKSNGDDPRYYYWKGVVLHDGKKQERTGVSMVDAGDNFHQLRWYAGNWEYFHDNTWKAIKSDDTVIAYYLQKFTVSKEIDTFTRDYGASPNGEQTPDWPGSYDGFAGVAFAVVYPDGTLSRTEKEMYQNSELLYTTANPNSAGLVYAKNNSNYVISHITATKGRHTVENPGTGSGTGAWTANGEIQWNKITRDDGSKWYDEVTVWNKESGTEPSVLFDGLEVDGKTFELRKDDALLVLIYLEVVYTPDNLNLVYWDDAANTRINPNDIQIVVESGVTFLDREKGLKGVDPLQAGQITLPDNAYIINSSGETQYISKNIAGINGVAANYRSGIYEYKRAEISEDGKTLTLHYDLKPITGAHEYVVDFGLPVKIEGLLGWFNITNVDTVNYLSVSQYNKVTDSTGSYGTVKIDEASWNYLTYTLDKPLSASAIIPLYANVHGAAQSSTTLKIIPATNVYYEDSFVGNGFKNGTGAAASAVWKVDGKEETAKQALSELGSKDIYGNDEAYKNSSKFSMGSAKTVTVNSGMLTNWNETSAWPTATFTFKGTGFDIISLTNNQSGAIIVTVYKNGNAVKNLLVNNYYGYTKNENGEWVVNNKADNCLYQIPVIQVRGLDYGEYTAEVKVFYNDAFNQTAGSSYSFWFDGFRVYDPMGKDNSIYTQDNEGYPQYIKLRDEIAKASATATATVKTTLLFIDGAAEAKVEQYKNGGPNNEVYLAKDQAISFKLPANGDITSIQIGAKSPNASDTAKPTMSVKINNTTLEPKEIGTATEMYYKISESGANAQQVTITNTGGAILSLTNIKITYSEKFTIELAALAESDEQAAVAAVRALYAAPEVEPVEPFKPDHFEAKWSNNVRQGGRAVLTVKTSADVEEIIINGDIVVSNYKTRTERVGYGWNAERVTYHVFTYMISAQQSAEYSVVAVNEAGLMSEAVTARLTVRPKDPIKDWFDGLFGGWF